MQFAADPGYFLRRWLHDPAPESFGLVQEVDGEVVGHVHVFARRLVLAGATARCAGIGNVAVAATHRGRRLARPLLEACLEECAAEGYEVALLSTHLRGLYERFGFEVVPSLDRKSVV